MTTHSCKVCIGSDFLLQNGEEKPTDIELHVNFPPVWPVQIALREEQCNLYNPDFLTLMISIGHANDDGYFKIKESVSSAARTTCNLKTNLRPDTSARFITRAGFIRRLARGHSLNSGWTVERRF